MLAIHHYDLCVNVTDPTALLHSQLGSEDHEALAAQRVVRLIAQTPRPTLPLSLDSRLFGKLDFLRGGHFAAFAELGVTGMVLDDFVAVQAHTSLETSAIWLSKLDFRAAVAFDPFSGNHTHNGIATEPFLEWLEKHADFLFAQAVSDGELVASGKVTWQQIEDWENGPRIADGQNRRRHLDRKERTK